LNGVEFINIVVEVVVVFDTADIPEVEFASTSKSPAHQHKRYCPPAAVIARDPQEIVAPLANIASCRPP
jgi:hypothetical protein